PEIRIASGETNASTRKSGTAIDVAVVDPNGLLTTSFQWDSDLWSSPSNLFSFSTVVPSGDGQHILRIVSQDVAGNKVNNSFVIMTDDTPPTIMLSGINNNSVQTGGSTISLILSDMSGLGTISYSWDGANSVLGSSQIITAIPVTAGIHTLEVHASDAIGNGKIVVFVFSVSQPTTLTTTTTVSTSPSSAPTSTPTSSVSTPAVTTATSGASTFGFEFLAVLSLVVTVICQRQKRRSRHA
ncbi:MAG TPA: hypothetical protein VJ044_02130, partial [Candidatus Hodarchaeales archaeon]|nr:hypothetical protein [Candidatus Hodarchaeales archaeon]